MKLTYLVKFESASSWILITKNASRSTRRWRSSLRWGVCGTFPSRVCEIIASARNCVTDSLNEAKAREDWIACLDKGHQILKYEREVADIQLDTYRSLCKCNMEVWTKYPLYIAIMHKWSNEQNYVSRSYTLHTTLESSLALGLFEAAAFLRTFTSFQLIF